MDPVYAGTIAGLSILALVAICACGFIGRDFFQSFHEREDNSSLKHEHLIEVE
jgi:hypothetical protein